jgi:outer membrane protein TolC
MTLALGGVRRFSLLLVLTTLLQLPLLAEKIPLKRVVELATTHSVTIATSQVDQQRAFSAYQELHDQYLPQFMVGSGVGQSWGYPLTLEGLAPSIVNMTTQSVVYNPALREFINAARTERQESTVQSKDQRDQVIQDTVLSYAELCKWQSVIQFASHEYDDALKMERVVNQRIQEGVDSSLARNQARLVTARVYLRISQAQGAIDLLRNRLSQLTGLPAASIEGDPDSVPSLPEVKQDENLISRAEETSPAIQVADLRARAMDFRAKGEHRTMLPSFDFAGQYALLAAYNNYQNFFRPGSFERHNGSVGAVIRFPFFNPSQRAKAQVADAEALRAHKDIETTKNQVSEQTLKLQRSVDQLAAAQHVAELEYDIARSNLDTVQTKIEAGTGTVHDAEDARVQATERYGTLQDANFELERARISLLRMTGDLNSWVGISR